MVLLLLFYSGLQRVGWGCPYQRGQSAFLSILTQMLTSSRNILTPPDSTSLLPDGGRNPLPISPSNTSPGEEMEGHLVIASLGCPLWGQKSSYCTIYWYLKGEGMLFPLMVGQSRPNIIERFPFLLAHPFPSSLAMGCVCVLGWGDRLFLRLFLVCVGGSRMQVSPVPHPGYMGNKENPGKSLQCHSSPSFLLYNIQSLPMFASFIMSKVLLLLFLKREDQRGMGILYFGWTQKSRVWT